MSPRHVRFSPAAKRTRRSAHTSRQRAFSLVELALVVGILAVALAIAAPRYQGALTDYRAEAAARRVVSDLHAARRAAEQTSRAHEVSFDLADHTVRYSTPSLDGERQLEHVTRLAAQPYEARLASVDFDGETSVTFDGFGAPHVGGAVVIRVASRERTVVLEASSGRARVQ